MMRVEGEANARRRDPRFGDLEVSVAMNHDDVVLVKLRRIYQLGLVRRRMSNRLG
jgi:hypothetical protein